MRNRLLAGVHRQGLLEVRPDRHTANRWPAGTLLPGWGIPGYLGKDCDTSISAWCDPTGNWGIIDRIRNRADAHSFQTGIEFGHVDHHDFATYVVIATHATEFVTVAKGEDRQTRATGAADPAIAGNYDRINIARPVLTLDGSVGLPVSFKTRTNLSCTPPQTAR